MSEFSSQSERLYLFSYNFCGERYSFDVLALSAEEARMRVARMAQADFDGEVVLKMGVPTGVLSRWLAKFGL